MLLVSIMFRRVPCGDTVRTRKRGYQSMLDYFLGVNPTLNEPLYTRPVRTVV